MRKNLFLWQLTALTFTAVFGTLFHFLFDWTGIIAFAPFCAVNESTWEHMKIFFFPLLIFGFIQYQFFKNDYPQFWCIKCAGIVLGTTLIPILFYTYNGAFGRSPDWLNILFFFLSAVLSLSIEYPLFKKDILPSNRSLWAILLLLLGSLLFIIFTFLPLHLPLFQDPISGLYGII